MFGVVFSAYLRIRRATSVTASLSLYGHVMVLIHEGAGDCYRLGQAVAQGPSPAEWCDCRWSLVADS